MAFTESSNIVLVTPVGFGYVTLAFGIMVAWVSQIAAELYDCIRVALKYPWRILCGGLLLAAVMLAGGLILLSGGDQWGPLGSVFGSIGGVFLWESFRSAWSRDYGIRNREVSVVSETECGGDDIIRTSIAPIYFIIVANLDTPFHALTETIWYWRIVYVSAVLFSAIMAYFSDRIYMKMSAVLASCSEPMSALVRTFVMCSLTIVIMFIILHLSLLPHVVWIQSVVTNIILWSAIGLTISARMIVARLGTHLATDGSIGNT